MSDAQPEPMGFEAAAGELLARAFYDDPTFAWAIPDPTGRRLLGGFFTGLVRWGLRFGEVKYLGPDEAPKAVAIWGARPASVIEQVRAGLLLPTVGLGFTAVQRLLRLGSVLGANHRLLCPEAHRYLYFVGVDPPDQRKGLGAELLGQSLAEADQQAVPCYLETATEANVRFYAPLGFETAWEGSVVAGAPYYWLLKRRPR